MSTAPDHVVVCECFARDGLQHETRIVSTAAKVAAVNLFSELGLPRIEVTSFSHPERVPQFADAEAVLAQIDRRPAVVYKATCVNVRAVHRAATAVATGAGPTEISLVVSASEAHSLRNVRRTHEQMRAELDESVRVASAVGLPAAATIATAFGCPFTGTVDDDDVELWVEFFAVRGIRMVSLGDTTGMANPWLVRRRFERLRERWPDLTWIGHFHDTRGTGIANIVAAIEVGVDHIDSSFGGLGGHPPGIQYGDGNTGNVATEDLVAMLDEMGLATGIDTGRLLEVSRVVADLVGRPSLAKVSVAGLVRDAGGGVSGREIRP